VLTMQDALLRLSEYWASQGCLVAQPMNTEVGAGTLNPATFLRVLGPEPWRVAYVEPSVRPDDSRYGENPNRIQTHTQFQVILKPEPGDAQERYLRSLSALGVDLARHDLRFVEDNWASPALGAWGLGWEVWLDGLEITQFTYFQQAGGLTLDPVSVEITYGMERILMAVQGVSHFKDIVYAPGVTYGEAFGQGEYEMSAYYLDDADVEDVRAMFDACEREARRLIEKRRPVPAHVYVLKCSHAFNVLDARGAIGTTERARAFARMRALAHGVAELWVERRAELGHPLGVAAAPALAETGDAPAFPEIDVPAPLAFEIGVEELPAAEVTRTVEAVRAAITERLAAGRLRHGPIRVAGTPRRIAVVVHDVQPREDDHRQTVRGPRVVAAYDADGQPTAAARGFARSQGVEVGDLERLDLEGHEFVAVTRHVRGRPAAQILAELLSGVVADLRAERNMRWSAPGLSFARPIRCLLAVLGQAVVPVAVSSLRSDAITRVHRTADPPAVRVHDAARYLDLLGEHGIVVDGAERRAAILAAATSLAAEVSGRVDARSEAPLLDEIANLVEQPVAVLGHFDRTYLELPRAVLTMVMRKHQRYLPVRGEDGGLLPSFVAVANGECDRDAVRAGNEAVLRARYEDATFFWRNDLRVPPARMREGLRLLTFEERLGSMADRAARVEAIAGALGALVPALTGPERDTLRRAGELVGFDLASEMVVELSSLAGVMAREYALRAGETPEVAEALFEAALPRFADDLLPVTRPGAILALADRLDLLAGLFAVGPEPTGSSDPFGLRRAALGVVATLCAHRELAAITLSDGLREAALRQPVAVDARAAEGARQFVVRRLEQYLLEAGHPVEHVRAVLPLADSPVHAEAAARELGRLDGTERFGALVTALQRVERIVPAGTPAGYDPGLLSEPAERGLHDALVRAGLELDANGSELRRFVEVAGSLVAPIDRFFVDVLVMDRDPAVRANRLGLLASVRDLGSRALDWRELR
jgi:glycyl-tRNA synthetase